LRIDVTREEYLRGPGRRKAQVREQAIGHYNHLQLPDQRRTAQNSAEHKS